MYTVTCKDIIALLFHASCGSALLYLFLFLQIFILIKRIKFKHEHASCFEPRTFQDRKQFSSHSSKLIFGAVATCNISISNKTEKIKNSKIKNDKQNIAVKNKGPPSKFYK